GDRRHGGTEAAWIRSGRREPGTARTVRADREDRLATRDQLGERGDRGAAPAIDELAPRPFAGPDVEQAPGLAFGHSRQLGVEPIPPFRVGSWAVIAACAPPRLDLGLCLERIELADHDPRLLGAVPAIDLELNGEVQGLVLAAGDLAVHSEGDSQCAACSAHELKARVLSFLAERPDLVEPPGWHQQPGPGIAHAEGT